MKDSLNYGLTLEKKAVLHLLKWFRSIKTIPVSRRVVRFECVAKQP